MSDIAFIKLLTPIDLIALGWFLFVATGYNIATRFGPLAKHNLMTVIQDHRNLWMQTMAKRENRMVDIQILNNLSQGNAFFASTSIIVIGGLFATLGAGDKALSLLAEFSFAPATPVAVFHAKMLVLVALFIIAFFKFARAFRLSHYTAIMIGATPLAKPENTEACADHAQRTAKVAGLAAYHSTLGLRTFYFAMAALGWFLHPILFIITTTWVVIVLYRREHRSNALMAISEPAQSSPDDRP